MKLILQLLYCGMIFIICGCQSSYSELIINKWRPVAVNVSMPDSIKKELFGKTIIEFTRDGKYYISGPQMKDTGTYILSDKGTTLTVTGSNLKITEMSIDSLNAERIVFTTRANNTTTTAVRVSE